MKALLIVLSLCGVAAAQSTGGRMGGGDWSDSHSGGSTSPSWSSNSGWSGGGGTTYHDYSSTPSFPSSSPTFPSSSSSPGSSHSGDFSMQNFVIFCIGAGVIILWFVVSVLRDENRGMEIHAPSLAQLESLSRADVSVLRIAVDGRARKFVQEQLDTIARAADTSTASGRQVMLGLVALMLRKLRDAWVYGGAVNEPMRPRADAKKVYDRYVDDARSRFQHETVANVQGTTTRQAAPDISPRSEGAGLILISLIIASRNELYTVSKIEDGEDLRKAIEAASHLAADQLMAVDVVWMPSEEGDRMSSMELEAKYPSPEIIPLQGALVGKTFCTYCTGPFPAELASCPHCGAPVAGRAA